MQIGAEKKHGFHLRKWTLSERKIGVHNATITTDLWSILVLTAAVHENDLRFR